MGKIENRQRSYKTNDKGYFADLTALQAKHPTGKEGRFASVGDPTVEYHWSNSNNDWMPESNQVQADWNETDSAKMPFIKNKPTALSQFSEDATHRTVTDTEKSTWNGKQDALGFTPEDASNKSNDIVADALSIDKYPNVKVIKDYVDNLVAGLLDFRYIYDASVNTRPATGGSGTAGAILKGDTWIVSVAGTLGGKAVTPGDALIAVADTPGQTAGNWSILQSNIDYAPEDSANKTTSISALSTDIQYPSAKLLYDQLLGKLSVGTALLLNQTVPQTMTGLSDGVIELISSKIGTSDKYQRVDKGGMAYSKWTADINAQSGGILDRVHGTCMVGDIMYGAMNLNANTYIVRFNDPNDLTDVTTLALTGYKNIFQIVAPGDGYLYAAPLKGVRDGTASDILILKIEEDLSSFSVRFDDGTIKTQRPVAMCTDGEFIYVATSRGVPTASQVGKIKLADASLSAYATWTDNSDTHAMTCYKYSNRTEIYTGSTYKAAPQMGKFTANAGVDASLTLNGSVALFANNDITDDMAYVNINDSGGYVYVASESTYLSTRINTAAMTAEPFWLPASYGIWNYYGDLYATSMNGEIIKFPNADINNPEIYNSSLVLPNELFVSSTGRVFVTEYGAAKKLSEITLNKDTDYTTNSASYSLKMGYENLIKYPFGASVGRRSSALGFMSQVYGRGISESVDYTTNLRDTLRVTTQVIPIREDTTLPIAAGTITRVIYKNMTSGDITVYPVAWNKLNAGAFGVGKILPSGATYVYNKTNSTNRQYTTLADATHIVKGVGVGLGTPLSGFDMLSNSLGLSYIYKNSGTTLSPTECVVNIYNSGIVTLPSSATNARRTYFIRNGSSGDITLTAASGQTIGNNTQTWTLHPKEDIMLVADGVVDWKVFCGGVNKYVQTFNATTSRGTTSGGLYEIQILQDAHNKGRQPVVRVQELVSGEYKDRFIDVDTFTDDATLNVSIRVTESPDGRFEGRVIII